MVHSNIFGGQHKRPRVCSWGASCSLIVPQLISRCTGQIVFHETILQGAGSCGVQLHQTSPSRLRICRLMHRQLPGGSDKLDVQHRRNRRLVLATKQRVFRAFPSSSAHRATLPSYFQKRLKRRNIGKCTFSFKRDKEREEVEQPETSESVRNSVENVAVVPGLDALKKNYKEYCAIQWTIRLWFSMLQERLEELEQGTETTNDDDHHSSEAVHDQPKEEKNECASPPPQTAVEDLPCKEKVPKQPGSSDHVGSDKETDVPSEGAATPDRARPTTPAKDGPKDDDVPLEGSVQKVERPMEGMVTPNRTPIKDCSKSESPRASYSLLQASKSDILDPAYTCDIELEPLETRKSSFVDSLLNKFNLSPPVKLSPGLLSNSFEIGFSEGESSSGGSRRRCLRDRKKIAARPRYIEIPEEPRKVRVSKVFGQLHKSLNIDLESTHSDSSTEFYGFDEGEVVKLDKPSLPGLLPTPIVKKSQPYAPFLSYGSTIGATDDGSTGPETRSDLFREEGLISFGSLPPRLECPQRPNDMVRPRTVAQKRILLQKENDVRYLMIDNESKIFTFLEKRSKNIDAALDFQRMKELQDQPIPFTRDTWRALSWLRTEKGRYYFQTLNIDNRTVKLTGCQGNHPYRKLTRKPIFSSPVVASGGCRVHYVTNCRCPEFPENLTLDLPPQLKPPEKAIRSQRLKLLPDVQFPPMGDYRTHRSYPHTKPGPLSSKCVLRDTIEDDPYLGPREVFCMPPVELEVFPKINRPLDGYVKPFLKMILPHRGITENWARFAVSTLRPPLASEDGTAGRQQPCEERSFIFQLPYANNQRRMLIRRRLIVRPGTTVSAVDMDIGRFQKLMEEQLSFRESIDRAVKDGGEIDADERICADVLSEMTDSVAIALAEDVFLMDDPDGNYTGTDKPVGKEEAALPKVAVQAEPITPTLTPPPPSCSDVGTSPPTPTATSGEASKVTSGGAATNHPVVATENSKTNDPAKSKLLREMKRLNATIIESPSQPKVSTADVAPQPQRCNPQYCAHGCICDVLSGPSATDGGAVASAMRKEHCRQVDCVLGCKCGYEQKKAVNYSQMDSSREVKHDGTPLFSADMKHLHEEVTERLAKEERQFTSTVIVTDEAAVVVRNAESETRRQKKMPKKYDDYYNEKSVQCLLNGGLAAEPMSFVASEPPANMKPLSTADRMRHAHVVLNPLPELESLEPWCMVHELYRCFCGGTATHGKPFSFTEESIISTPSKGVSVSGGSVGASTSAPLKPVNGTVATASRMMKAVIPTVAASKTNTRKVHTPNGSALEEVTPATAAYDTRRKRLYSFEKPHTAEAEGEQQRRARLDRFGHSGTGATSSSGQCVTFRRRERDSSEESYRPPSEKKSSKAKKVKFSADGRRASVAVRRDSVVASRASLPLRRASIAARGKASFFATQEDDEPSPPPSSALRAVRRSELMAAPKPPVNVQYAVVSQPAKNAMGKQGISNIIIKRIPPPSQQSPPSVSTSSIRTSASSGSFNGETSTVKIVQKASQKGPPPKQVIDKDKEPIQMTAADLRRLMKAEYHRVETEKTEGQADGQTRRRSAVPVFRHIEVVDTSENIDSFPHLNNLTGGTKTLVICGNKRAFVDNSLFQDGKPPAQYTPFTDRYSYIIKLSKLRLQTADDEELSRDSITDRRSPMPKLPVRSLNVGRPATSISNGSVSAKPIEETAKYNQLVIDTDRQLVSLMRHINELLTRNSLSIHPAKRGIMYICRWKVFLRSFVLSQIDVLDVMLKTGVKLTVVTGAADHSYRFPPETVQSVTSARRSTFANCASRRKPSMLQQMLIQRVENAKTDQLALVLYGSDKYWHFCGFLQTGQDQRYINNRNILLEPSTQARATVRVRLNEYYCRAMAIDNPEQQGAETIATSDRKTTVTGGQSTEREGRGRETSTVSPNLHISGISPCNSSTLAKLLMGLVRWANTSSPESGGSAADTTLGTRWLRLALECDFSDMFIPSLSCNMSYGRLMGTIGTANRQQKVIQLQLPGLPRESDGSATKISPRLYSIPGQGNSIFIGPYPTSQTKLDVVLCQMVDGKMYTREEFQRRNAIDVTGKPGTVGHWIDMPRSNTPKSATASAPSVSTQRSLLKSNVKIAQQRRQSHAPDDDCVVVLDEDDNDDDGAKEHEQSGGTPDAEHPPATGAESLKDVSKAEDMVSRIRAQLLTLNGGPKEPDASVGSLIAATVKRPGHEADRRLNLLRLVETTMEQTKEDKRKLASMVEDASGGMGRAVLASSSACAGGGMPEGGRKRKSTDDESTALRVAKVVRKSAPTAEKDGSSSSNNDKTSLSFRRNAAARMSLPNPFRNSDSQPFKVPQAVAKPVTPHAASTGGSSSSGHVNGLCLRAPKPGGPPNVPARAMSMSTRPTNGIINNGKQQLTVKPLTKLMSSSQINEDDVVCLDDDDDREDLPTPPVGNGTVRRTDGVGRQTTTITTTPGVKDMPILNDEQERRLWANKLEYLKTVGRGVGFDYNVEKNTLKMKRWFMDWLAKQNLDALKRKFDSNSSSCSKPAIAATVATITPAKTTSMTLATTKASTTATTKTKVSSSKTAIRTSVEAASATVATVPPAATTSMTLATPKATTKTTTTTTTTTTPTAAPSIVSKTSITTSAPLSSSTAPETTATVRKISMPRTKVVPRRPTTPPTLTAPSGGATSSASTIDASNCTPASSSRDAASSFRVKYLTPALEATLLAKPHRLGILESKISGLGLVPIVQLEHEVIIRVKELTGRGQHVSVPNLEEAVSLLNTFIQTNTYTFMPHNLSIQWEFKERSTALTSIEDLTKIINHRCIVTRYGLFDTSKRESMKEVQRSLPALHEELMLASLAIQCCPKQLYESQRCYENVSKVYERGVDLIAKLNRSGQSLVAQEKQLREQMKQKQAKLEQLRKGLHSGVSKDGATARITPVPLPATTANSESVIVIDDD